MSRADEESIRKIIADMTDASTRHDAKAATRWYAADADFVTARGERFTGAAEIEERLAGIFAIRGADVTVKTLSVTIRFVRPDVAVAHVTNELRGLADAGFPNGVDIVLNGPQGRYARDKEVAEAVTAQLTKAGIRTTLRTFDFVNYLNSMVYAHKAGPVWLIGWGHQSVDAESVYVPLFRSGSVFANWHNESFNRMVDEAQKTLDDRKRLEQYQAINKLWLEEVPAIPLYQQLDLYGVSKRLAWKARSDDRFKVYDMTLKDDK